MDKSDGEIASPHVKIIAVESAGSTEEDSVPEKAPTPPPQRQTRSLLKTQRPTARKSTAALVKKTLPPQQPPTDSDLESEDDEDTDSDVEIEFPGGTVLMTSEQYGQMKRPSGRTADRSGQSDAADIWPEPDGQNLLDCDLTADVGFNAAVAAFCETFDDDLENIVPSFSPLALITDQEYWF